MWNISVTTKIVKKVERTLMPQKSLVLLYSSGGSKKRTVSLNFLYILVKLFNVCLRKSCFTVVGRSAWWSLYLRLRKVSTPENCLSVRLLSLVSKLFEKFINIRLADRLKRRGYFLDFQCSFRSFWSTVDLLTIVFEKIAGCFNKFKAIRAMTLGVTCWSSSQIQNLWNSRSSIGHYFVFSHEKTALRGSAWGLFAIVSN